MRTVVPDAGVLLAFYLPGEPYKKAALEILRAYTEGRIRPVVPVPAYYEVLNGLSRSVRELRTEERLSQDVTP